MGNSSCTSWAVSQQSYDIEIDQEKTNAIFQNDYKPPNQTKSLNAKNKAIGRIKCFDGLSGSKDLNFGVGNPLCTSSTRETKRKTHQLLQYESESNDSYHLEPIVFSEYNFSANSSSSRGQYQNQKLGSIQQQNKHLSSTCDEEEDQAAVTKTALDYISSFVGSWSQLDVNKEQFVRIKKQNIQNDYTFHQKLGEGAFGEVYKCQNIYTGEPRAVKVLKKSILINLKVKEQFLQEFNLLKKLDHPNVIKIFEIYQMAQSMYIVFELCRGNSLASYLKNKVQFSNETKREILRQLFLGVNYLHRMNITHRDLKPDNMVFINQMSQETTPEQVDLRIIDLGLAIEEKEKIFKDWTNIGTYNYMAPESFGGIYSTKCDSWSCGVIMYALLLDFNPFRGFDADEVRKNIQQYSPAKIDYKDIGPEAIELLVNLTKMNFVIRWSMKQALQSSYFKHQSSKSNKGHVLDRLSSYTRGNGLVSAAQSYLSFKKIKQADQFELAKHFHSINSSKSGIINAQEFASYFSEYQLEQIQSLFRRLDKNRSGTIDFCQFLMGMSSRKDLFTTQNLREVFDFIDINKNGQISKQQLKYFLRSLDKTALNQLVEDIAQNDRNKVTFEQFSSYLQRNKWL